MKLLTLVIICIACLSCSKETIPGITGEYFGTYKYISTSVHSNDEFLHIYDSSNWPSSDAKVTVSIESNKTMKIVIRSELRTTRIRGPYEENAGTYNCKGVKITDGYISYYKVDYGVYHDHSTGSSAGGWVTGESLKAYRWCYDVNII